MPPWSLHKAVLALTISALGLAGELRVQGAFSAEAVSVPCQSAVFLSFLNWQNAFLRYTTPQQLYHAQGEYPKHCSENPSWCWERPLKWTIPCRFLCGLVSSLCSVMCWLTQCWYQAEIQDPALPLLKSIQYIPTTQCCRLEVYLPCAMKYTPFVIV